MGSKMRAGKLFIIAIAIIVLFVGGATMGNIVETNESGYYQVKQAAMSGDMSVRSVPGMYSQMFGKIWDYKISDMNYFSTSDLDGGDGEAAAPIKVRFNDGGTALISGSIKFKLSLKEDNQLELHEDFKSFSAVQADLVRQTLTEALMQSATLMKAEESYSTRRSEFTTLAEEQIKYGIYETISEELIKTNAEGTEFLVTEVRVKTDDNGKPVIRKSSPFVRYDIQVLQFVIKDIDFDETIDNLIAKKKEAEQQRIVAQANAEKAKQDAITAEEQGKARIATATANAEVEKATEVTNAEKASAVAEIKAKQEVLVAELNEKKANANARALLAEKKADAEANALLVRAGLTPEQKANIAKETAIGVAAELAKTQFPQIMNFGTDTGVTSPLEAVGYNQTLDLIDRLTSTK